MQHLAISQQLARKGKETPFTEETSGIAQRSDKEAIYILFNLKEDKRIEGCKSRADRRMQSTRGTSESSEVQEQTLRASLSACPGAESKAGNDSLPSISDELSSESKA